MIPGVRLAIDTASDRLSVGADAGAGTAVAELVVQGARRHAASLVPLIGQVLDRLGARVEDIVLVAVSDGPGSFTGLRVGIAAAKALALGGRAPLVTAPSLLVRAAGIARPGERVLAISSALRGEVYAGAWQLDLPRAVEELLAPRTIGLGQLDFLPACSRIVGDGPEELVAKLRRRHGAGVVGLPEAWPSAVALLRLVGVPGGSHDIPDAATWEPTYGRPAEAQARWEREHGRPLSDPRGNDA